MRAIILAAGYGRRLAEVHRGPKCLLPFAGKTLLQRHLDNLAALKVDHIAICIGHEAQMLATAVARSGMSQTVSLVLNPDFRVCLDKFAVVAFINILMNG